MGFLSPQHILLALAIGLLLFGRKLPEMGRSIGKTFKEFQKGMKGLEDEVNTTTTGTPSPTNEPAPLQAPQRVTPPSQKPIFDDVPTQSSVPPKV